MIPLGGTIYPTDRRRRSRPPPSQQRLRGRAPGSGGRERSLRSLDVPAQRRRRPTPRGPPPPRPATFCSPSRKEGAAAPTQPARPRPPRLRRRDAAPPRRLAAPLGAPRSLTPRRRLCPGSYKLQSLSLSLSAAGAGAAQRWRAVQLCTAASSQSAPRAPARHQPMREPARRRRSRALERRALCRSRCSDAREAPRSLGPRPCAFGG